jgi:hypothetical protein
MPWPVANLQGSATPSDMMAAARPPPPRRERRPRRRAAAADSDRDWTPRGRRVPRRRRHGSGRAAPTRPAAVGRLPVRAAYAPRAAARRAAGRDSSSSDSSGGGVRGEEVDSAPSVARATAARAAVAAGPPAQRLQLEAGAAAQLWQPQPQPQQPQQPQQLDAGQTWQGQPPGYAPQRWILLQPRPQAAALVVPGSGSGLAAHFGAQQQAPAPAMWYRQASNSAGLQVAWQQGAAAGAPSSGAITGGLVPQPQHVRWVLLPAMAPLLPVQAAAPQQLQVQQRAPWPPTCAAGALLRPQLTAPLAPL